MTTDNSSVLIAYDGSEDADRAIEHAGAILGGGPAVVVTVWEPLVVTMSRRIWLNGMLPNNTAELDERSEEHAAQVARTGSILAERAGFSATPRWVGDTKDIAAALNAAANDVDARLIVTGARGLQGFRAHLLGSVSSDLVRTANRPVLVVPPPDRPAEDAPSPDRPVAHLDTA